MHPVDYAVLALFAAAVVAIGFAAVRKVGSSKDFFVGGGRVPWWLAGVSLHVSGYSAVVFVAWAGVAYRYGFTLYVWWALPTAVASIFTAYILAPRWARLRASLNVESPTEYLLARYGVSVQQTVALSGVILKVFDVGAKWAALGILLEAFTGLPRAAGIVVSGIISLSYVTAGGLWADLYTNFVQFVVQVLGGTVLFVAVVRRLGGPASIFGLWSRLPPGHLRVFNGPFTPVLCAGYVFAAFLSSGGGTWNQAVRYLAAPSGQSARRSAILCGALYAFWPLVLFFPMWAAPLLLPAKVDLAQIYPELVLHFLPTGLVGLLLAAVFATTMSMATSDTNTISAVMTRDILPRLSPVFRDLPPRRELLVARLSTFAFIALTLVVAIEAERFGGVLGLTLSWFFALVGPISIPMLGGLLPAFQGVDSAGAMASMLLGFAVFAAGKCLGADAGAMVAAPIFSSALCFGAFAWLGRKHPSPHAEALLRAIAVEAETR